MAKGGFAERVIEEETKAIFPVIGLEGLDVVVKEACNNIEICGFTGLNMRLLVPFELARSGADVVVAFVANVEVSGVEERMGDFVEMVGVDGEEMLPQDSLVGKPSWVIASVMLGAMIEGAV